MATLKEAVESGRRWRITSRREVVWYGPTEAFHPLLTPDEAISSNFEIEPEPEKPREWFIYTDGTTVWLPSEGTGKSQYCWRIRVHDADACDRLRGKP